MPPTRQFAHVTSEYLGRCRASALSSPAASPGWDPTGDPDGDAEFLNDEKIYDGFGDPLRLLTPAAVTDIAAALGRIRLDDLLSELPTSTEEAAPPAGSAPDSTATYGPTSPNTSSPCGSSAELPRTTRGAWSHRSAERPHRARDQPHTV